MQVQARVPFKASLSWRKWTNDSIHKELTHTQAFQSTKQYPRRSSTIARTLTAHQLRNSKFILATISMNLKHYYLPKRLPPRANLGTVVVICSNRQGSRKEKVSTNQAKSSSTQKTSSNWLKTTRKTTPLPSGSLSPMKEEPTERANPEEWTRLVWATGRCTIWREDSLSTKIHCRDDASLDCTNEIFQKQYTFFSIIYFSSTTSLFFSS